MNKCFIMGMPDTGKTTYLAALWYSLNNNKNCSLVMQKYCGDVSYLYDISIKWAKMEKISRTTPEFEKQAITLNLENKQKENIVLVLPDLSGETFQFQYINREVKKEHYEFVKDCTGTLLFIHPHKITNSILISDLSKDIRNIDNAPNTVEYSTRNPIGNDSTQVQLVELLQFTSQMRSNKPLNLCIIISAWDLIKEALPNKNTKPENFISDNMPLLWQYLVSNSQQLSVKYFGISALGGKLEDSDKLSEFNNPCDRIIIVDNDGNESSDITIPLNMIVSSDYE